MLKELLEKLLSLTEPMVINVNGKSYSNKGLSVIYDHIPKPVEIGTLTGFSGYIESEVDPDFLDGVIHVISPNEVTLFTKLTDNSMARPVLIRSTYQEPFRMFGQWMELESFIISLQSQFVKTETSTDLLKLIGNIKDGTVTTRTDDGIGQDVTVKTGITKVEQVTIPNPIHLKPFRTFPEVDQPASPFVFRMKSGRDGLMPQCALFEADGGAWKMTAIQNILAWFHRDKVTGTFSVIA